MPEFRQAFDRGWNHVVIFAWNEIKTTVEQSNSAFMHFHTYHDSKLEPSSGPVSVLGDHVENELVKDIRVFEFDFASHWESLFHLLNLLYQ